MMGLAKLDGYQLKDEVLIPATEASAFKVMKGDRLQIIDPKGQQVGDLVAFKVDEPDEYFSPAHTITQNWSIKLNVGDVLASNKRNDLMRIVQDTVGYHDILVPCCDPETYITRYGIYDHRSCLSNIREALDAIGLKDWTVHGEQAWNVFMKNEIASNGDVIYLEPTHGSDSFILLEVLEDLICALSACPQDKTPTNGPECTEMLVRVWGKDRPAKNGL